MGKSAIPYLERVINGTVGCSGKGCQAHCWARDLHNKRHKAFLEGKKMPKQYEKPFNEVQFFPERLQEALHRKKSTVYGVSFTGDLFDEQVDDYWIAKTFGVMAFCQNHTFIILTKQPQRMADFFLRFHDGDYELNFNWWLNEACSALPEKETFGIRLRPRPNVFLGVTVCTQAEADERIPELLKVPGKKWISIEPMLGPIELRKEWIYDLLECSCYESQCGHQMGCQFYGKTSEQRREMTSEPPNLIDAIILGGESGPKARPMHPDWIRSIRDQCAASGTPFYFKQWGRWRLSGGYIDGRLEPASHGVSRLGNIVRAGELMTGEVSSKEWDGYALVRSGSTKAAGRTLDGRTHDELPWRK